MAVMLMGLVTVGLYMVEIESDLVVRFNLTQSHKSVGVLAFALGVLRILWRVAARRRPRFPENGKPWERHAARVSHLAFYLLMLALPVSGWLMASASPLNDADAFPFRVTNMVFGLFELPDPFKTGSKELTEKLLTVHFSLAVALLVLLAIHIAASIKHAVVDGDNVMRRMVFGSDDRDNPGD